MLMQGNLVCQSDEFPAIFLTVVLFSLYCYKINNQMQSSTYDQVGITKLEH